MPDRITIFRQPHLDLDLERADLEEEDAERCCTSSPTISESTTKGWTTSARGNRMPAPEASG